jgi:hypothetical protein
MPIQATRCLDAHRDDPEFATGLCSTKPSKLATSMAAWTAWRIFCATTGGTCPGKLKRGQPGRPAPPAHGGYVHRDFPANVPNQL